MDSRSGELKLAGRALMARAEEHRARLQRIDNLIHYHEIRGHTEEVRKLEALRQREINAFEQTLSQLRRLLGSSDFERLSRAVRFVMNKQPSSPGSASSESARPPSRDALSSRAGSTEGASRARPSIERSLDRQLMLERSRASRRMQLAQRLQEASNQQLRLMAEQRSRFQPAAPIGSQATTRRNTEPAQPAAPATRPGATRRPPPPQQPTRRP